MAELITVRKDWHALQEEEQRMLRSMTVQEGLQQLYRLQVAFEWQLQQTEELFASERREYLAELQRRIHKLIE